LFWGILDGETISIVHFGGMAMILAGVYITRK
jgi:drug/metabolite transporter (DMT)-like permease